MIDLQNVLIFVMLIFITYLIYIRMYKDHFQNIILGSKGGFGFEILNTNYPLFLNMYPKNLGADFKLRSFIQKMKYLDTKTNNESGPVIESPMDAFFNKGSKMGGQWDDLRGIYTQNTGLGQINIGKVKTPVILIPGLGTNLIFAKWDLSSSQSVKTLDIYGDFESKDKWSCRQLQENWIPIWFPQDTDGLARYCWETNVGVKYTENGPANADGVLTTIPRFGEINFIDNYMDTLVEALEANGYVKGSTLFAAPYDFRTITNTKVFDQFKGSLIGLIKSLNTKVIILGHDLGAVLGNVFLNSVDQNFKSSFISKFISVGGSFGGSPKALRTILSGPSLTNNVTDNLIIKNAIHNFSGLHLSLPNPSVFKDPLIMYQYNTFGSSDISNLLNTVYGPDTQKLYDASLDFQNKSLLPPKVPCYILAGSNIQTESNYVFNDSITDDPERLFPYYDTRSPNQVSFNFDNLQKINAALNGDGTTPDICTKYIINNWAKQQTQTVKYQVYNEAEHLKIISMNDPVRDIINIVNDVV